MRGWPGRTGAGPLSHLVQPAPGLAAAEHAAKSAPLNTQAVRASQRNRRVIGAAGLRVKNSSAPFGIFARLHIDENLVAVLVRLGVHGISTKIGTALLDPDLALFFFGQPNADRICCRLSGGGDRSRRD